MGIDRSFGETVHKISDHPFCGINHGQNKRAHCISNISELCMLDARRNYTSCFGLSEEMNEI